MHGHQEMEAVIADKRALQRQVAAMAAGHEAQTQALLADKAGLQVCYSRPCMPLNWLQVLMETRCDACAGGAACGGGCAGRAAQEAGGGGAARGGGARAARGGG